MSKGIFFQEISGDTSEFLHELSDPDLVRAQSIPSEVSARLRGAQVEKLQLNISTLRKKQAEFNRKMDDYVGNLERLIRSLESVTPAQTNAAPGVEGPENQTTMVRCQNCEDERTFDDLNVLFARESEESIHQPTECYVSKSGEIKKGVFFCSSCGGETLTIQSQ